MGTNSTGCTEWERDYDPVTEQPHAKMSRAEHLAWCRQRAHAYLAIGDVQNAIQSMMSDLQKHDETRSSSNRELMALSVMMSGNLDLARRYIEGFT